jgi:hypothetical protein
VTGLGRTLIAILLGILVLFPGVLLLKLVVEDWLGIYHNLTLTDCLLVFVIILLIALLLQPRGEPDKRVRPRREDPDLTLVGNRPPASRDRSQRPSSGRRHTREPSQRRDS